MLSQEKSKDYTTRIKYSALGSGWAERNSVAGFRCANVPMDCHLETICKCFPVTFLSINRQPLGAGGRANNFIKIISKFSTFLWISSKLFKHFHLSFCPCGFFCKMAQGNNSIYSQVISLFFLGFFCFFCWIHFLWSKKMVWVMVLDLEVTDSNGLFITTRCIMFASGTLTLWDKDVSSS